MSCTSPLWFLQFRSDVPKGKVFRFLEKPSPVTDPLTGEVFEPIQIPCGQCRSCRIHKSREWANRCVMESMQYEDGLCWFVTLTYDDEHLPPGDVMRSTLFPSDVTKFFHDLRQYYARKMNWQGLRYFYAGEYGDLNGRPHYHILLFNCPILDNKFYKLNYNSDTYWTSQTFTNIWSKGYVVIGELNWNSAAYTARYTLKKLNGDLGKEYYKEQGILPEFCRMSNRPGIGAGYLQENKDDIYQFKREDGETFLKDEIILPSPSYGKTLKVKPPKYFDRKMKESLNLDDNAKIAHITSQRKKIAELSAEDEKNILGYNEVERFRFLDEICKRKFHTLARSNISDQIWLSLITFLKGIRQEFFPFWSPLPSVASDTPHYVNVIPPRVPFAAGNAPL